MHKDKTKMTAGILAFVVCTFQLSAQSRPATTPAFEVASIKPNQGCGGPGRGSGGKTSPGRMTLECAQLRDLILTAYGIYANGNSADPRGFRMPILGGPGW